MFGSRVEAAARLDAIVCGGTALLFIRRRLYLGVCRLPAAAAAGAAAPQTTCCERVSSVGGARPNESLHQKRHLSVVAHRPVFATGEYSTPPNSTVPPSGLASHALALAMHVSRTSVVYPPTGSRPKEGRSAPRYSIYVFYSEINS